MPDQQEGITQQDFKPQSRDMSGEVSALSIVEERLAKANSPQEIILMTQIRGEIMRQNEAAKDQNHRRWIEKIGLQFKIGFSICAFGVGTGLVIRL
jgi:hypothetical protein